MSQIKGQPLLAWLIILAAVAFILWRYETVAPLDREGYDLLVMRLQSRYLVGLAHIDKLLPIGASAPKGLYEEAQSLNRGPYSQRLRFVVLAGELKGPAEAREQLHRLNDHYRTKTNSDPPAEDFRTAELLERLYTLRAKKPEALSALPPEEQRELRQRLNWFGELALTPDDRSDDATRQEVLAPAYRAVYAVLIGGFGMAGLALLGLVLLVTFLVLWFLHRLTSGLTTGAPYSGVYAETFALYMLLFLGLGAAGRYGIQWSGLKHGTIALSGLAALCSLAALGWPVLRGIPWRQVRQDIGWTLGRRPWLEPLFGAGCYVMALPMLLFGLVIVVLLMKLRDLLGWGPDEFGPSNAPGHPIVFWATNAGWWVWLEVLFVAVIVAPLVEETMFRGVLYRHLREASSRWRPVVSVFASALVVSFLFAVIHPQGFVAVPALMMLALAFALIREWRGTLIPAMIAHGLNNAVATALLVLTMS